MTSQQTNSNTSAQSTPESSAVDLSAAQLSELASNIKAWGVEMGFDAVGISDGELSKHEAHLNKWLEKGMQGEMDYMHKHGSKRTNPDQLVVGTKRVISVRMDYAPADIKAAEDVLENQNTAYISRYALGRDYHKVVRSRLKKLAQRIQQEIGQFGYRVFTDSAPVMEKALAEKAGLGWIGKHSNLLDSKTGSWFFLGEIYVDLPLPTDAAATNHCGSCQKCIDVCPTQAIVGPYQVDARLCISYLTIELKGSIPVELRSKLGNRIYGCDDCQFVCPWNKFAQTTKEPDFTPREQLTDQKLVDLFSWTETDFLSNTEGTAIRRIGYQSWLRNIAVSLGNADSSPEIVSALRLKLTSAEPMLTEHILWALEQHAKL
jgi:epoxyqueuosine reductase